MSDWRKVDEPKIWTSSFLSGVDSHVSFGWQSDGDRLAFLDACQYLWQRAPKINQPTALFFVKKRLPNHYVLNVHQPRETLIPELSENIEQSTPEGQSAQVTTYSGF